MVKLKEDVATPKSKQADKTFKNKVKPSGANYVDNWVKEKPTDNAAEEPNKSAVDDPHNRVKTKTVVGKEKREIGIEVPEHVLEVAYIVKDNAAIRRFTSLNILNYLIQTGRIKKDGKGNYVKFLWNKFRVSSDGLTNEYLYSEQFFIKALAGAFGQFASSAQDTIAIFMDKEGVGDLEGC